MPDSRASMLGVIRRTHIFDGLRDDQLARVTELCREESYAAGHVIFAEGSPPRDFYIVIKGKVALDANFSARPGSWKRGTVDVSTQNQLLGWSALVGSAALTLSARAVEDTRLLALDGAAFRALLVQDPQMGYLVMQRVVVIASSRLLRTKETMARILSIASHDLRAPLNAVQSYMSVLAGGFFGEVPERQKAILERCGQRLSEAADLIDNILDITRFEEGLLVKERLSLSDLVRDGVDLLRSEASRRGIALDLRLPDGPILVQGSAPRLKQVMSNLLGNAIKFTPPGGEVHVRLTLTDALARVEVADTGVGISPQDLPHIFDEFYQGETGKASSDPEVAAKGVGLGLSICHKIIQAHRGRIWAESPCRGSGCGSLFVFTLPQSGADMAGGRLPEAGAREGIPDGQ